MMKMDNLDEVSSLIRQIKEMDGKLSELNHPSIFTISIKGSSVNIDANPVKNSINRIEKAAMVYMDSVKEALTKEMEKLQHQLKKKLQNIEFPKLKSIE